MLEQCPISTETVGAKATRLTAGLALLAGVTVLATSWKTISVVLAADFFLRAFGRGRLSPFRFIVRRLVCVLNIRDTPVNAAPKVFAAKIGFGMALLMAFAGFAGWTALGRGVALALSLCAGLEAFASVCVGCHLYSLLIPLFPAAKRVSGAEGGG